MGARFILACGDCAGVKPPPDQSPLGVILIILGLALICGLIFIWQRRRGQRPRRVTDHWSTVVVMGELCPHGWQAEITFHGGGAPVPDEEVPSRSSPVAVEWKLYEHAIRKVGATPTLLEWDDRIPSFDEVFGEARKAEKFLPAATHEEALV